MASARAVSHSLVPAFHRYSEMAAPDLPSTLSLHLHVKHGMPIRREDEQP